MRRWGVYSFGQEKSPRALLQGADGPCETGLAASAESPKPAAGPRLESRRTGRLRSHRHGKRKAGGGHFNFYVNRHRNGIGHFRMRFFDIPLSAFHGVNSDFLRPDRYACVDFLHTFLHPDVDLLSPFLRAFGGAEISLLRPETGFL